MPSIVESIPFVVHFAKGNSHDLAQIFCSNRYLMFVWAKWEAGEEVFIDGFGAYYTFNHKLVTCHDCLEGMSICR